MNNKQTTVPVNWFGALAKALRAQDGWFDAPKLAQEAGIDGYDDWGKVDKWLRALSALGLVMMRHGHEDEPLLFRWSDQG